MRFLEIASVLIALGFLLAQNARGTERRYLLALGAAGVAVIALSASLGQLRWQMAPAYLLHCVLCAFLFKRSHSHAVLRAIGASLGLALVAASMTLSLGLPILTLPPPVGPYPVGSASLSLTDESRHDALFGEPGRKRELYVQVWYPGQLAQNQPAPRVKPLWEQLHRGDLDRFTVFSRYLRAVNTHSYENIPVSTAQPSYPAIVFSHAMVSFAEQSTLLMEHLASHGYVVLAVGHTYTSMRVVSSDGRAVYPDLKKINDASAELRAVDAEYKPKVENATTSEERVQLQLERYERAHGLNEVMAVWVGDLRFVLDAITDPERSAPELREFSTRIDADRIGLLGMSFGGGAVTELCKADTRCRAAENIDGDTFGQRQHQALTMPYLALIREDQKLLHYLLPASRSAYYEVAVAGTTHLDFTDDALVLPVLKWTGTTGRIEGKRAIEIANAVSLRFFDAYLRDGPKPRFDAEFPELTVETNEVARR